MSEAYCPWTVYKRAVDPKLLHRHKHQALGEGLASLIDTEVGVRVSEGRFFDDEPLSALLGDIVKKAENELTIHFDWSTMGRLQMTRYRPGGKYEWHVDNDFLLEPTGLQRKWTVVVGISRPGIDFTGGGLELMWTNATRHAVYLDEGDAVVFPSTLLHRGGPVHEGERWILVAWAQGQALR
ncbi:2OG-Fe(II) oxygenase [Pendulispora albinea]|uniref:2OG-Fe(II) oxygenase n=1 Tax=Pendulispora albinea TaxID=2741071 RepID=A0ABZ2M1K0_9BACT